MVVKEKEDLMMIMAAVEDVDVVVEVEEGRGVIEL